MALPQPPPPDPAGRQARDVMAFGQEIGRVLSDGRIIGRAEPFAKVFPSSRAVKRAVGLAAWGILEDIALDARLDERGRLVADTTVATNLGLSKTTVHKHLGTLRECGFVFHEELREAASGRYEQVRYVIDPSACIERFTVAPASKGRPTGDGDADAHRGASPNGRVPDPGTRSVSHFSGHGELVQNRKQEPVAEQRQQVIARGGDDADRRQLVEALTAAGVAGSIARQLVDEQPGGRIRDALEAVAGKRLHNPAGWIVRAIGGSWDLSADVEDARGAQVRAAARAHEEAAAASRPEQERRRRAHETAWEAAISAAFDDEGLAEAIERLTVPVPGLSRRSVPTACAALRRWAQAVAASHPREKLPAALRAAMAASPSPADVPDEVPPVAPPQVVAPAYPDLAQRVARHLNQERATSRAEPAPDPELSL